VSPFEKSCQPVPITIGIVEDVSLSLSKMSAWACRRCQPELVEGDSEAGFGKLNLTVRFPGANAD